MTTALPWIENPPKAWDVVPLFAIATDIDRPNYGNQCKTVLSLSYGRIIQRDVESNFGLLPATFERYNRVEPGNIVLRLTDLQNDKRSLRTGLVKESGVITSAYTSLRLNSDIDPRFAAYYLHALDIGKVFYGMGGGVRQSMSYKDIKHLPLPRPKVGEQRAIADFLDRETGRIDALVEKKRRLIELLGQRAWAALLANVGVLSSQTLPLRRLFLSITDGPFGSAFSSSDYTDEGAAVVRLGNIGFAEYRQHDQARIPFELYSEFRRHSVVKGDLLIAGLGDAKNHAGRACVAPNLAPAIVKGKCFRARVDRRIASAKYLAAVLSSPLGASLTQVEVRGSTRSMINLDIVKALRVPVPELAEQERLAAEFDSSRARNHQTIHKLQQQLDLLAEYRQALITAAVTGQIDVESGTPHPKEALT